MVAGLLRLQLARNTLGSSRLQICREAIRALPTASIETHTGQYLSYSPRLHFEAGVWRRSCTSMLVVAVCNFLVFLIWLGLVCWFSVLVHRESVMRRVWLALYPWHRLYNTNVVKLLWDIAARVLRHEYWAFSSLVILPSYTLGCSSKINPP